MFPASIVLAALAVSLAGSPKGPVKGPSKGTVERIKVHGKSLEGNLEGDSPDRDVIVYLPPSYQTNKNQHYPVVYFLHGYGIGAEAYWNMMKVADATDRDIAAGTVKEMILVHPDANTIYNGSMYSNSPTTGDWEAYITQDLVSCRQPLPHTRRPDEPRSGRAFNGRLRDHSDRHEVSGRILQPVHYERVCLLNNPGAAGQGRGRRTRRNSLRPIRRKRMQRLVTARASKPRAAALETANSAEAAAWSPNPKEPAAVHDLPAGRSGAARHRREVGREFAARDVRQYVPNLKKYHAIANVQSQLHARARAHRWRGFWCCCSFCRGGGGGGV